jgi:hypothetical protein
MPLKGFTLNCLVTFFFAAAAFSGCAVAPVNTQLPADHPANPQAPEPVYRPPPNPFQESFGAQQLKGTLPPGEQPASPATEPSGHHPGHESDPGASNEPIHDHHQESRP